MFCKEKEKTRIITGIGVIILVFAGRVGSKGAFL